MARPIDRVDATALTAHQVKVIRKGTGLTQAQFAERIGVSRAQTVSTWEVSGLQAGPTAALLRLLATTSE